MARKKGVPCWRPAFLRALARTGNVRAAARVAEVDHSTVYLARRADAGFAGRWVAALEKAKAKGAKSAPRSFCNAQDRLRLGRAEGEAMELVVRVSKKHGRQLVKASAGRWSARVEAVFLAQLKRTGCVKAAAFACGLSPNALHNRRKKDEDFAEKWRAADEEAGERLPGLLTAAAIAALDPEIDESELPPVNVSEAIRICRMKGLGTPASRERMAARALPRVATNEEVREALTTRLEAFRQRVRARMKDEEGWTETEEGGMIPPGWVYAGAPDAGGAEDEGQGEAETLALPAPEERGPRIREL
jgi:hypothetical protein